MHEYGENFYRYLSEFAKSSAKGVIPVLTAVTPIHKVVDFGCGLGGWLSAWKEAGMAVTGLDGPYVDRRYLLIDAAEFMPMDLSEPIDLGCQFDLVQSLEVAEHIPAIYAERFVETLTSHGKLVMFSAAVPGQGGEHHVNEQPMEYWRELFRRKGYVAVDYIRPMIRDARDVQHWYRYNIILYVHRNHLEQLPQQVRNCAVPEDETMRSLWPWPDRIQHGLQRLLPRATVDQLSRLKAFYISRRVARARSG